MRIPSVWVVIALAVAGLSSLALADVGGKDAPPTPPTTTPRMQGGSTMGGQKSEAETYYGYAFDEIARAKKDLAKGDEKKARKRFDKSLRWSERAVEFNPKYHEAWNLVGYSARKLGDYDRALEAYATCLELAPHYVPAREYLGEAYVDLGRIDDAKVQLGWLRKLEATEEAEELAEMIAAAEKKAKPAKAEEDEKQAQGEKPAASSGK